MLEMQLRCMSKDLVVHRLLTVLLCVSCDYANGDTWNVWLEKGMLEILSYLDGHHTFVYNSVDLFTCLLYLYVHLHILHISYCDGGAATV